MIFGLRSLQTPEYKPLDMRGMNSQMYGNVCQFTSNGLDPGVRRSRVQASGLFYFCMKEERRGENLTFQSKILQKDETAVERNSSEAS